MCTRVRCCRRGEGVGLRRLVRDGGRRWPSVRGKTAHILPYLFNIIVAVNPSSNRTCRALTGPHHTPS